MLVRTAFALAVTGAALPAFAATLTGTAAYGDYTADAPGVTRKITINDLPADYATKPGIAPPAVVARPADAKLRVPPGFSVTAFAKLEGPRQIRLAPNGDIFVAESERGRVSVLRAADGAPAAASNVAFAEGLDRPFGIAFYPLGPKPKWVYVANANSVVRFAYKSGDLKASGPPESMSPASSMRGPRA